MIPEKSVTAALIQEVEKRNILWNPKHKDYKVKSKRREAWTDLCCHLVDDYKELPEEMQRKILKAAKQKWMAIQEMYFVENSMFKMNFNDEKSPFSPLERLLYFIRDVPPIINSWYHVKLESDEISEPEKKEGLSIESETKGKIDVSEVLGKYLSSKLMEMDEDWAFLNKLLTLVKTLNTEDKSKFRKQVFKCVKKLVGKIETPEGSLRNSDLLKKNKNGE